MKTVLICAVVCLTVAVCAAIPDTKSKAHKVHEPIHEDHYKDGEHNPDYDHEAVLGSKESEEEYSKMDPEEAKARLGDLVDKMDTNSDGFVSKQELAGWIEHSFRTLDDEEAENRFKEHDANKNQKLTWKEYLEKVYSYKPEDIDQFEKDKNSDMKDFAKSVRAEEEKFKHADKNKDGSLDISEFSAFLHPWDHPHMRDLEMKRAMQDYDKNKDTAISFDEYLGDGEHDKETKEAEKEQFVSYDRNKNGKLEGDEIKTWILPDHRDSALEEAVHLIGESDANKDGKLTKPEIQDKHDLWVGSQATDFGRSLHDAEEL